MTNMDEEAISWVGDMYQRFEAICTEVEETIYQQDSVKYVGACVKKFYSDVFQDFLSLSSDDPLKPESPDVQLVHYTDNGVNDKSEVDTRREHVKVESEKLSRDSYLSSQLDENLDDGLSTGSSILSNLSELPSQESSMVNCLGLDVKQNGIEELKLCNNDKSEDDDCRAGEGKMCDKIDETNKYVASSLIVPSSSEATTLDELVNDEDMSTSLDGTSYEPVEDETERDHADKEALQVSEQLSKMKLDESCVLVDKYVQFPVPHPEGKQRSYKKIRDVFYLRRWSRRKNQKQLDVWQEEMDSSNQGSRKIKVSDSALECGNDNLQSNSLESGWEIL